MKVIEFLFFSFFLTHLYYMVIALFLIYLPLRDLDIPKYSSSIDILTTYPLAASE